MDVPLLLVLLGILERCLSKAELASPSPSGDVVLSLNHSGDMILSLNHTNASDSMQTATTRHENVTLLTFVNATWNETDLNNGTFSSGDKATAAAASSEELLEKFLDEYRHLINKTYWQQRMQDPHFLGEMLVPFMAGIAVSLLLVLFICSVKICCCSAAKRRQRKSKKFRKIKNDQKNKDGHQWTLLERNSSEEEL